MLVTKLLITCMTLTWLIIKATVWGVTLSFLNILTLVDSRFLKKFLYLKIFKQCNFFPKKSKIQYLHMVKIDNRTNKNTKQTWVTLQVRVWRMKYEVLWNSETNGTSPSHSVTTHAYVTTTVCAGCSFITRWVVGVRGWCNVLSSSGVQVKTGGRPSSHYESVSAQCTALLKRYSQMLEVSHSHPCSVSIQLPSRRERKHAVHAALEVMMARRLQYCHGWKRECIGLLYTEVKRDLWWLSFPISQIV